MNKTDSRTMYKIAQALAHLWYWNRELTDTTVKHFVYGDSINANLHNRRIVVTIEFEKLPVKESLDNGSI